jgi:transcriptional regulator with XRE-family HTH domain
MDTVSETLRAALLACTASYREIGEAIGVDHSQLSRFARGDRGLSVEAIDRVAEYLGLELRKSAATH